MFKRNKVLSCILITIVGMGFSMPATLMGQTIEKISFDNTDSTDGYYLAIRPMSGNISGAIVLLTSFLPPEGILAETKLHNVAYVNDLLTIVVSSKMKFFADTASVVRINKLLDHVVKNFAVDSSKFVITGYDDGGTIALRYTELAYENNLIATFRPAAVFGIESNVDVYGLWQRSENEIRKNYYDGAVGDAKFYLDVLIKTIGAPGINMDKYKAVSPFYRLAEQPGNEQFLNKIPVRLYYDADINWQLRERRNSFYDLRIADGSEMIKRLMLAGNREAELMIAKQPGMRSNGQRHPISMSIVDEVECIQWIKSVLKVFDPQTFNPPYQLSAPAGWGIERFKLPPDFAKAISFKGIEDIRFMPGWGDSTSIEHWSYTFLWWLHDSPKPDVKSLELNLQLYFNGLVGRNTAGLDVETVTKTAVVVKRIKTAVNDLETWSGAITMFDYHTKKKMVLNVMIHSKKSGKNGITAVLFGLSPQPFDSGVWKKLGEVGFY